MLITVVIQARQAGLANRVNCSSMNEKVLHLPNFRNDIIKDNMYNATTMTKVSFGRFGIGKTTFEAKYSQV